MGGPGVIDDKQHHEVDNFLPANFVIKGVQYFSAENYFQAAKCTNLIDRERVRLSGCGMDVYKAGRIVFLRPDWEIVKVREMYIGNRAKFEQNPNLSSLLLPTVGPIRFYGSTDFWCYWNGLIMELIRAELRNGDGDAQRAAEIWGLISKYEEEQKALCSSKKSGK